MVPDTALWIIGFYWLEFYSIMSNIETLKFIKEKDGTLETVLDFYICLSIHLFIFKIWEMEHTGKRQKMSAYIFKNCLRAKSLFDCKTWKR